MKCTLSLAAAALALAALAAPQASAQVNLLVNPGFEAPVTSDGAPFIGSWEAFQGIFSPGGTSNSANGAVTPRTGLQHLDLDLNGDDGFAGAFQDVVVPGGLDVTFSGWHLDAGGNTAISEVRIEWRDSVSNTEISRTPNSLPIPGVGAYTPFSLTATAPLTANIARVVYAIQTFTDPGADLGNVFVDDTSVTVIPEPSTLVLAGASLLGAIAIRRRRR